MQRIHRTALLTAGLVFPLLLAVQIAALSWRNEKLRWIRLRTAAAGVHAVLKAERQALQHEARENRWPPSERTLRDFPLDSDSLQNANVALSPGFLTAARSLLHIRHHSLFTPRDFDVSPYFQVIKPTLEQGFDFRKLTWEAV